MTSEAPEAGQSENSDPLVVNYLGYLLVGLISAALWTAAGTAVAFFQGDAEHFLREWLTMQVPACFGLATALYLIVKSGALAEHVRHVTQPGFAVPFGVKDRRVRALIFIFVSIAGTASFVAMGFNFSGATLIFMWVTAAMICAAAGIITLHTVDLLVIVHRLKNAKIKTFQYSPARTPELRRFISYFTWFTLILSIAYCFAFVGTIKGHWNATQTYIQAVQWFWPLIYVPTCTAALIYPHLAMHGLIQRTKERTLKSYQAKIDSLLANYQELENEDVQRINSLTQLFDRLSATPDYVVDVGIGVRTALPLLFNLIILAAKPLLGQS